MTDSIRIRAIEKIANGWNPLTGFLPNPFRQRQDQYKQKVPAEKPSPVRKRIGDALVYGGHALAAQGQADSAYRSWKARKMISEAPKLTPEQTSAFIPHGLKAVSDAREQSQIAGLYGDIPKYDIFSRWFLNSPAENLIGAIQNGENAAYLPREYGQNEGTLLTPPSGVNETILAHELGHRNADFSRRGAFDYRNDMLSARKEDIPILPQDMFTAPSTNAFGQVTLPGLEREAWEKAPAGMKIDPKIREAALGSYTAARKANAKNFYGNLGVLAGKMIRPKKNK